MPALFREPELCFPLSGQRHLFRSQESLYRLHSEPRSKRRHWTAGPHPLIADPQRPLRQGQGCSCLHHMHQTPPRNRVRHSLNRHYSSLRYPNLLLQPLQLLHHSGKILREQQNHHLLYLRKAWTDPDLHLSVQKSLHLHSALPEHSLQLSAFQQPMRRQQNKVMSD